MVKWEQKFAKVMAANPSQDSAHDLQHFRRVVRTARQLCIEEGARLEIVIPAAWLHDFVMVPKDDPRRSQASRMAANAALDYLEEIDYPAEYLPAIAHAIESHSFSVKVAPETLEAKIVQDADRLDALGAIGIARCFAVGGALNRSIYNDTDPFCIERVPEDHIYTIDHFQQKLFPIAESLHTAAGRQEGRRRVATMRQFLEALGSEIAPL